MDSISPFSMLDRMRPGDAAARAHDLVREAAQRSSDALRDAAPNRGARQDFADAARSTLTAAVSGAVSDGTTPFTRSDTSRLAADPVAHSFSGFATAHQRASGAETSATRPAPGSSMSTDFARETREDSATPLAQTVVTAAFAGLDALARTPVQRLALNLAQASYTALRVQG